MYLIHGKYDYGKFCAAQVQITSGPQKEEEEGMCSDLVEKRWAMFDLNQADIHLQIFITRIPYFYKRLYIWVHISCFPVLEIRIMAIHDQIRSQRFIKEVKYV